MDFEISLMLRRYGLEKKKNKATMNLLGLVFVPNKHRKNQCKSNSNLTKRKNLMHVSSKSSVDLTKIISYNPIKPISQIWPFSRC